MEIDQSMDQVALHHELKKTTHFKFKLTAICFLFCIPWMMTEQGEKRVLLPGWPFIEAEKTPESSGNLQKKYKI